MILPRRRKREKFLPWLQLLADGVTILGVLRAVFWLRFMSPLFKSTIPAQDYAVYLNTFNVMTLIVLLVMRLYGLYKPARLLTFEAEAGKVCRAVAASFLVLMAATFFVRDFSYSRTFLALAGAALACGICLERFLLGVCVMWIDQKRGSQRNILMIGSDENAKGLAEFYRQNPRFSTRVVGFMDEQDLGNYIHTHREIHEVVLAKQGLSNEEVLKIIYECEKEMVTFRWIADIFGLITSKMSVSHLGGLSLLSFTDSPLGDWENRFLKRAVDITLSAAACVILAPFLAVIALWVKLDSAGPVFFGQQRIGEDGRRFVLLKFRTMKVGAEEKSGPVWAEENDPRRTRLGGFLRRNNLDELPQLWNVLAGDMSLVGPRPERPYFVSQFKEDIPRYMARHSIRSGITGWAQVNGLRGNTSIEERTKYDLYYIEHWSLLFDLRILLMTFLARRNAY